MQSAQDAAPADAPKKKRRWGAIITIVLLSLALAATAAFLVLYFLKLEAALAEIEHNERELDEQRELLDKKETFGQAMESLMGTIKQYDGAMLSTLVSYDDLVDLASRGWAERWDAPGMDRATAAVVEADDEYSSVLDAAAANAGSNATGSTFETVVDSLGGGHVLSVLDDADALCGGDVLACVTSDAPTTVHFDAPDNALPYMTDWIRTGLAYHEFAHVLQFTNPTPTEVAVEAFGGDVETMADCYALTYLDGWTLDHKVFTSSYSWWEVSIGYGHTCDETQRQAIIDWYESLGVSYHAVSQN